jgi:anti-sigma factor ChrR (cupin superfamily)
MAATTPSPRSITKPAARKAVRKQPVFDPFGAALVRANEMEWIGKSAGVKMLRISQETGWIAALVRGRAGQINPPHTHLGPACFYVIEGGFEFRGGSARAGDWVWEPAGAVHPATSHPVDTVYLSYTYGPVMFHDKDGREPKVIDFRSSQALLDRVKNGGAQPAPRPEGYFDSLSAALVRPDDLDWIDDGIGNQIKILRVNEETGFFHLLIKAKAGQVNPAHTHLGPADFYVIEGGFDFRGGSARVGDWVYEPTGAVHEATTHPLDTIYLANVYGPVAFHKPNGDIAGILDWRAMKALAAKSAPRQ